MVNATPRSLYPQGRNPVHIFEQAGWAPGSVWSGAENLAPNTAPLKATGMKTADVFSI